MGDQSRVFVRKLLIWYKKAARSLPWRETRNPYAVLVSEFMLQQTQVSRVLDYYPRFLKRFPTIETLARAHPKTVREAWEGMGYYARAANLHALAKQVAKTGNRIPDDPEELRTLPGVGPYTAGAVACFAYEKAVPAVDTNVKRVLSRAFEPDDVWELAEKVTPRDGKRAWRFNQALMELGALVCTARKPRCEICPVNGDCKLFKRLARPASRSRNRPTARPR
ncbi:MAG TPA: A/G-specific adenine glycosylase [Gemmatimonadales bacterium]|nr:A/G-specific adenine glycosylase [Gemmatimonadales bacterium]